MEHRDELLAASKAWREANKEKQSDYLREWKKANPDKLREYGQRQYAAKKKQRLARQMLVRHGLSDHSFAQLLIEQQGQCYLCQADLDMSDIHIDHDHRCCPPQPIMHPLQARTCMLRVQ